MYFFFYISCAVLHGRAAAVAAVTAFCLDRLGLFSLLMVIAIAFRWRWFQLWEKKTQSPGDDEHFADELRQSLLIGQDLLSIVNSTLSQSHLIISWELINPHTYRQSGSARGAMVIVVGNTHSDMSSKPRRGCLHFTRPMKWNAVSSK